MFKILVKAVGLTVEGRTIPVKYFEVRTLKGSRYYSAEILLGPSDRIILDDDSAANLEVQTAFIVPVSLYSRALIKEGPQ